MTSSGWFVCGRGMSSVNGRRRGRIEDATWLWSMMCFMVDQAYPQSLRELRRGTWTRWFEVELA